MRSDRNVWFTTALGVALLAASIPSAIAQDAKEDKPEAEAHPAQAESRIKPQPRSYSVRITIKESVRERAVNEKSYELNITADDPRSHRQNVRDDVKVPYRAEKDWGYQHVGMNVDALDPVQRGDALAVLLVVNGSSVISDANVTTGSPAEISEWTANVSAVLPPGKPVMVYSSSDGASGHKVEIVATAQALNTR
jgi:hypothetical protein